MVLQILERVMSGLSRPLAPPDLVLILLHLVVYAFIVIPWGFRYEFLRFEPVKDIRMIVFALVAMFLAPCIPEEILFRGILLPNRPSDISLSAVLLVGWNVTLFVAYHAVAAKTYYRSAARVFLDPRFLLFAGFVGLGCISLYWWTESLWSAILFHWMINCVWLLLLGGLSVLPVSWWVKRLR
jgi:predicted Abi (CAAX) family protease